MPTREDTIIFVSRVAEPEPELEPAGAETFSWSRSWSQYTKVSAPAPAPGQTKVVYLIIIHIEQDQKSIFFPKSHEKSTFSFRSCENRHPQSSSRSSGAGAETF